MGGGGGGPGSGMSQPMRSGMNSGSSRYDTISVQKSWITDYKAGRLTVDAFKQKVLQYAE
jgi:hypothetical protein